MAFIQYKDVMVTCPFDNSHRMKASVSQYHIAKCKLDHMNKDKESCPYNATHFFSPSERNFHIMNCPDRVRDPLLSRNALYKNNLSKGQTAVPAFSEPLPIDEENWDEDLTEGYVPSGAPPDAIMEAPEMSRPAEKKQFYDELHRQHPKDVASNPYEPLL